MVLHGLSEEIRFFRKLAIAQLEKLACGSVVISQIADAGLNDDDTLVEADDHAAVIDDVIVFEYPHAGVPFHRFLEIGIGKQANIQGHLGYLPPSDAAGNGLSVPPDSGSVESIIP